jgi:signal transduction histidine kinase
MPATDYSYSYDLMGLSISIFMFVGLALIAPLFRSIRQSEETMKAAMVKAEEEKAKTESIIAAIGDGISIHDRDLRIIYQNTSHISYFGAHQGELCYRAYRHVDVPCESCPVLSSFQEEKIYTPEMIFPGKNGPSYFEVTISPLKDAGGNIVAGIEVVRNIDRRKKLEKERESLINELQEALEKIKTLHGLLPICASCKAIRDDQGYWKKIEEYIEDRAEVSFSHGICPNCAKKLYPDIFKDD